MDAADPLLAASSATRLLRRTLGPAPAASPSKADEALLHGISGLLKGSKELVEQARMAMKEHGDIRMLYQDDGAQAAAAANGMNNQLRRRPAGDRKRHRFTVKPPASEPEPYVDRSILDNIADPCEYFKASDRFDDAEVEQKRLKGEPTKKTFNYEAPPRRRRGSVRSFNLSVDAHNSNAIEIPASQTETMTESQLPQDDAHASVSEKDEHSVPSRSSECAVPDVSVKEDLVAEKDNGDALTYLLTSFRILDGSEEQDFVRKTLGIEEIRMEKVCHRDSVPADRPLRRDTARTNPARVHTPEGPLPGSHHARVSELEKRISFIVAAKDKCMDLSEDDGSEGSPDIVMGERSLMRDSSDVILMTDETFAARETDRETPSPCVKSAECVHDPEPNMTDHVTIEERQAGGSPLGLYRDTKVTKENDPCSRHDISMEEDDVPMDYSTKSNNETEISSHHLEGSSTEVLVSTPGRNMAPHDIARTSHAAEGNIQHQEVVEEDGIVQDKSIQSSEIPLEDIDPQIQSHVPDGNIKKLAADLRNALSPAKAKTQKAAQKGKKKQQSKRGKKMADESSHPLEIPQENFDSANQPHTHDVNIEQQTVGMSNALSPNKAKGQKESQRKNKTGKLNRRKSLADKSIHPSEIPLEDIDPQIQSKVPDGNIKKLAADLRNTLSPAKVKTQKAAQKGKKKQQSKRGETRADESSHPLEIPQENFDSDIQPHTHDVNIEQQTVGTSNALSPNKAKGQKQAQRRSKTEKLNRRKSLADAGLAWQSGVRRSTRIRSRPLEHWRGERFVYGRIHDTMATVIGIKAYSPGQDGKRALKVKSFVPEEYSDLVAESAKY